jgi:hypothetical protein
VPSPRRTSFLVALLAGSVAFAACADSGAEPTDTSSDAGGDATTTSTTAPAVGKGEGTFVVGDRTYDFEAKHCSAVKGDPLGTVLADGTGTFDGRPFTVVIKSSPGKTSVIETVQVVFAATEAVVGTSFVQLPGGASDVKFEVTEDGKTSGTIAVMGTGGQPSGEGTLTLSCEAA